MKSPCRYPGCRSLLDHSGYCPAHAKSARTAATDYDKRRRADPRLGVAAGIRDSSRWKRVRLLKLSMHPLCEDPFSIHARRDMTVAACQVHHIKGVADFPELAFDLENLQSLCTGCHSRAEQAEKRAKEGGA